MLNWSRQSFVIVCGTVTQNHCFSNESLPTPSATLIVIFLCIENLSRLHLKNTSHSQTHKSGHTHGGVLTEVSKGHNNWDWKEKVCVYFKGCPPPGLRFQGPAGFCFCEQSQHDASSLQAFKDHWASSSRPASQEVRCADVGCADGLKPRQMCFSRPCKTCVTDSLRPANMRYLQVRQRVGVARSMCAV